MSIIKATIRDAGSNNYKRLAINPNNLGLFENIKNLEITHQDEKIDVDLDNQTFKKYGEINHNKIKEWFGNKFSIVKIDTGLIKGRKIKITEISQNNKRMEDFIKIYLDKIKEYGKLKHIKEERYKFEFVNNFQKNFNLNAENLKEMIKSALLDSNLVATQNYYPKRMLMLFAKEYEKTTKRLLKRLLNEKEDVEFRINWVKGEMEKLVNKYNSEHLTHHHSYMDYRFISLLLASRYPKKYYYVKYNEYNKFIKFINSDFAIPNSIPAGRKYILFHKYCEELNKYIKNLKKIKEIKEYMIEGLDFKDERYHWVTQDVIYIGAQVLSGIKELNKSTPKIKEQSIQYGKKDALKELFLEEKKFDEIIDILKYKKNLILQGPPGTGKTFIAKKIAYVLLGKKDEDKIQMIQFHQSYSYEDFIQGYRPTDEGKFELKNGIFYEFCKKAKKDSGNDYFFIIDEINRGNLSKIFGENMLLIEKDKRGIEYAIPLTYSSSEKEVFYIPKNIFFIGTMNTADKSLAMVDYALRRRFCFVSLKPEFNNNFKKYLKSYGISSKIIKIIVNRIEALNKVIEKDTKNLGKDFKIGHSYFCPDKKVSDDKKWYRQVIKNEIKSLLEEYWFEGDKEKADREIKKLLE